jgi:hypothetical protein
MAFSVRFNEARSRLNPVRLADVDERARVLYSFI